MIWVNIKTQKRQYLQHVIAEKFEKAKILVKCIINSHVNDKLSLSDAIFSGFRTLLKSSYMTIACLLKMYFTCEILQIKTNYCKIKE